MFYTVSNNTGIQQGALAALSIRCPACKQRAVLEAMLNVADAMINVASIGQFGFGQRKCPNPDCRAHVFVIFQGNKVIQSYPAERLDFDGTGIPDRVKGAFEEAIACHAQQCFVAAAMMVRKTLEELCRDKGATGDNLKKKIASLGSVIIIPKELLQGADDLRLLGNDAAHIESQEYEKVGKEEVELAIEFTKEVLKAVYQYTSLLDKLRALKKTKSEDSSTSAMADPAYVIPAAATASE
jgi:hypothetical protein